MTYTYALLAVDKSFYDSVKEQMIDAGYRSAINDEGEIDMHGIALICKESVENKEISNIEKFDADNPKENLRDSNAIIRLLAEHMDVALAALQAIKYAYNKSTADFDPDILPSHEDMRINMARIHAWEQVNDAINLLEGVPEHE